MAAQTCYVVTSKLHTAQNLYRGIGIAIGKLVARQDADDKAVGVRRTP
ncbi:hypothetical protein GS11_2619 [Mycobacterium tuberculosis variant bovis BCG]|nr:hypothetical protein GS11_2619 [Mycobacterium tuberculosis variant bovis BCG]EQM20803.1 hypothetical protein FJ05194_2068 [Mycobacterium tuberculosis FJ05194]BAQ06602.1 hypothetical protein KURONO_2813 [Mycobacterium tuberculosis str. Kurono]COZ70399.1 Uncharacterised protein [Mycobacterium tuberculosis]